MFTVTCSSPKSQQRVGSTWLEGPTRARAKLRPLHKAAINSLPLSGDSVFTHDNVRSGDATKKLINCVMDSLHYTN